MNKLTKTLDDFMHDSRTRGWIASAKYPSITMIADHNPLIVQMSRNHRIHVPDVLHLVGHDIFHVSQMPAGPSPVCDVRNSPTEARTELFSTQALAFHVGQQLLSIRKRDRNRWNTWQRRCSTGGEARRISIRWLVRCGWIAGHDRQCLDASALHAAGMPRRTFGICFVPIRFRDGAIFGRICVH